MNISAVVLAKNEERNIEACLASLQWCDEVIVIDDNSTDKTVLLAKNMGTKVFVHPLNNNFSKQRNFGLENAQGDWIFFVDADERVSEALVKEIESRIKNQESKNGFFIKRLDSMWGKVLQHGETGRVKLLRLAKKNTGKWTGAVHETWRVSGKTEELKNPLMHYPHQTITGFLQEINFYTTLRAQELFEQNASVTWFDIIAYPKAKFIQNYFLKLGFLDGIPGFLSALFMCFHSFLVRGKLWQLRQKIDNKQ